MKTTRPSRRWWQCLQAPTAFAVALCLTSCDEAAPAPQSQPRGEPAPAAAEPAPLQATEEDKRVGLRLEMRVNLDFPAGTKLNVALGTIAEATRVPVELDAGAPGGAGDKEVQLLPAESPADQVLTLLCLQSGLGFRIAGGKAVVCDAAKGAQAVAWAQPASANATAKAAADPEDIHNRLSANRLYTKFSYDITEASAHSCFGVFAERSGIGIGYATPAAAERAKATVFTKRDENGTVGGLLEGVCAQSGLRSEIHRGIVLIYIDKATAPPPLKVKPADDPKP